MSTQEVVQNTLFNLQHQVEDVLFNLHLDVAVEENAQVKAALEKVYANLKQAYHTALDVA